MSGELKGPVPWVLSQSLPANPSPCGPSRWEAGGAVGTRPSGDGPACSVFLQHTLILRSLSSAQHLLGPRP